MMMKLTVKRAGAIFFFFPFFSFSPVDGALCPLALTTTKEENSSYLQQIEDHICFFLMFGQRQIPHELHDNWKDNKTPNNRSTFCVTLISSYQF